MSILGKRKQEKLTWAAEPITQKGWRRTTRRPAWKLNQTESAREKVLEEEALCEVLGAVQHGCVKLSLLSGQGWSWPAALFQFQAQDEQSPLEGQVMDAPVAWIMTSSTLSTFSLIGGVIKSTFEPVGLKQQDHKP